MGRKQEAATTLPPRSRSQRKSPSRRDQEYEDRLPIAERLARELRKAGYSCDLADDGHARALKRGD
jgi:hypothetical protein